MVGLGGLRAIQKPDPKRGSLQSRLFKSGPVIWEFPKLRGYLVLGILLLRILLCRVLC